MQYQKKNTQKIDYFIVLFYTYHNMIQLYNTNSVKRPIFRKKITIFHEIFHYRNRIFQKKCSI